MRRPRFRYRFVLLASLVAVALSANASPAAGALTLGQLREPNAGNCEAGVDLVQLGASSDKRYVVPGAGTITSWTVEGASDRGVLSIKVFRKVADPARFQVIGHAGPQTRTAGGTAANTFPASIPVRRGDLLGLHTATETPCASKDPAGLSAVLSGDLADGAAAAFTPGAEIDLDVQAVFIPDNAFSLGKVGRNKRQGTATLAVNLPNVGELSLSGQGIRTATTSVGAGEADVLIKAKGKTSRKLKETGKATVTARITYVPTDGDRSAQSVRLNLKRLRNQTTRR